MSAIPCALCATPVSDATVCSGCGRRYELALGDVPALVADLETVLAKLTVYADQAQRVTGSKADEVVPWNLKAGDARQHLHTVLTSWVRIVWLECYHEGARGIGPACVACQHESCKTRRPRHLPADRSSACSGWLLHDVEWVRHQRWADEAIGNLLDVVGEVRSCLDAPAGRITDPLGPCPHPTCNGEIRAYLPRDPATMCHADCTAEPLHTWDSTMFMRLGERMLRMAAVA